MNLKNIKQSLLGLFLAIFITSFSNAQSKIQVSAFGGYSDDGFATLANFAFSNHDIKDSFFEAGVYAGFLEERNTSYNVDVNVFSLNFGYFKRLPFLSSSQDVMLLHAGIGGLFGKEIINNGLNELPNGALIKTNDGTIYGGFASLQGDLRLNDKLSLLARYNQFYHANSETNRFKMFVGIGVKFLIF
ncbi:Conjugative transposon protein TraO [Tenacibaculum sp. MAR_2009_124]|uniref:conjugal transfer protein TraO n=1 Tax=Tenacibaculum sp. MAR_2009_124 TaxID=1250059 RepID=UPI0008996C7D|nr:conjugal transfer protein TraO [Tenacibaculum sp. MAR_2009_124]SEB51500.1 Conjugative transposon protein TraO [Tenacibaculum sp. MAR_2009_124]